MFVKNNLKAVSGKFDRMSTFVLLFLICALTERYSFIFWWFNFLAIFVFTSVNILKQYSLHRVFRRIPLFEITSSIILLFLFLIGGSAFVIVSRSYYHVFLESASKKTLLKPAYAVDKYIGAHLYDAVSENGKLYATTNKGLFVIDERSAKSRCLIGGIQFRKIALQPETHNLVCVDYSSESELYVIDTLSDKVNPNLLLNTSNAIEIMVLPPIRYQTESDFLPL